MFVSACTFLLQRCEGAGVETPFDIMGLEDEERDRLLDMPQSKVSRYHILPCGVSLLLWLCGFVLAVVCVSVVASDLLDMPQGTVNPCRI